MTDELRNELKKAHEEEIADRQHYLTMAIALDEQGHHHCAGIVRDIAHDEETHAVLLEHIMEKVESE